jgi:hypothetical protein
MMVVTKFDRERASLAKVLEESEKFLGVRGPQVEPGRGSSTCSARRGSSG